MHACPQPQRQASLQLNLEEEQPGGCLPQPSTCQPAPHPPKRAGDLVQHQNEYMSAAHCTPHLMHGLYAASARGTKNQIRSYVSSCQYIKAATSQDGREWARIEQHNQILHWRATSVTLPPQATRVQCLCTQLMQGNRRVMRSTSTQLSPIRQQNPRQISVTTSSFRERPICQLHLVHAARIVTHSDNMVHQSSAAVLGGHQTPATLTAALGDSKSNITA